MLAAQYYETEALLSSIEGIRSISFLTAPARLPDGTIVDYNKFLSESDVDTRRLKQSEVMPFVAEMLARGAGREGQPSADDLQLAKEAVNLDLAPFENSPIIKRAVASMVGAGAVALFTPAGPIVVVVGGLGFLAIYVVAETAWKGAAPEVEAFAGDASAALFARLRKKLHIPKRRKRP